MKRACVIGWPIGHSRSPLIHGYWIKLHGLDASYERMPVEPEELQTFLHALPEQGYAGCNVTIPHKENAYRMLSLTDAAAQRLGSVNTIYVRNGQLLGTNTDGEGFLGSLKAGAPDLSLKGQRAVILGAGGAAVAIASALIDSGIGEAILVNRTLGRAEIVHQRLGSAIVPLAWPERSGALADCAILINTTSLGMTGQPPLDICLDRLEATAVVADIVYTPLRTKLLIDAAERGHTVVEGLGMLLHQAVRGFELWFGIRPEVSRRLYGLVARDIDPDYRE